MYAERFCNIEGRCGRCGFSTDRFPSVPCRRKIAKFNCYTDHTLCSVTRLFSKVTYTEHLQDLWFCTNKIIGHIRVWYFHLL